MTKANSQARQQFRRMVTWIVIIAVLMVVGALTFLGMRGSLSTHVVVATILGVFFSVVLGCGLFALAFFSDKSGHDSDVSSATSKRDEP